MKEKLFHPSWLMSPAFETLAKRFMELRAFTEALAAPLSPEDQTVQSMPDASPTKWHLAHTSWFFEHAILARYNEEYQAFHPAFNHLFNSYYHKAGKQFPRANRGLLSQPTVQTVHEYRQYVNTHLLRLLERLAHTEDAHFLFLMELGMQHEQQHQELILTDIKHAFSCNPLHPFYVLRSTENSAPPPLKWLEIEGGMVEIGHANDDFAFDNEGPAHRLYLEPYQLASRPVTNREYREFMEDGGYARPELWLADGWQFMQQHGITAPLYWEKQDNEWYNYTLSGMQPLNDNEPVCHVSFYEAQSYATWAGKRLPTEIEWENAAKCYPVEGNFLNLHRLHPKTAYSSNPENVSLVQLYGDVWEWTASPYTAYPGFKPFGELASEYNGKFMCNQYVLKGGSAVTPKAHIRPTYRNFFPPYARWQFSGIRLAGDNR